MKATGLLVVVASIVVAAFWLWSRDVSPPQAAPQARGAGTDIDAASGGASGSAPRAARSEVVDATSPAGTRTAARPDEPADETFVVAGVVLRDPRMPQPVAMRVLAYAGEPDDRSGLVPNVGAGATGPPRAPFVVSGEPIAEARVDGTTGRFELRCPRRHLRLTIDHTHYLLPTPEAVHVPRTTRRAERTLSPLLGGHVRGRALGADLVREVSLTLEPDLTSALHDMRALLAAMIAMAQPNATPAADGTFEFRAVPTGASLRLHASGPGRAGRAVEAPLQPGETRDVVVPMAAAGTLLVTVLREDGSAVPGAGVVVASAHASGLGGQLSPRRGRTDERGVFRCDGLVPDTWNVRAHKRLLVGARATVAIGNGEPLEAALELRLQQGGTVTGVVHDPDGQPIAGAFVAHHAVERLPLIGDVTEQLGSPHLAQVANDGGVETDAEGRFRLTGISDDDAFALVAAHERFAAVAVRDVRIGDADVVLRLRPLATVRGRVVAARDGAPVREFHATLLQKAFLVLSLPIAGRHVRGADDGAFELTGFAADSYTLRIEAEGHAPIETDVRVPDAGELDVGTIELPLCATVRGVVRDRQGQPIANALVRRRRGAMADNPMLAMMTGGETQAYTDPDGRFELRPMQPGGVQLLASHDDFASGRSERLELEAGQQVDDVVIELGGGGTILGTLRLGPGQQQDDFVVLAQHQLTQQSRPARVSRDGRFTVENLDPGAYQVQAMPHELMREIGGAGSQWNPGEGMQLGEMMRTITDNLVSQRCTVRAGETAEVTLEVGDLTVGATWTVRVRVGADVLETGLVEATGVADGSLRVAMLHEGEATFGHVLPGDYVLQVRSGLTMTPVGDGRPDTYPAGVQQHRSTIELPAGTLRGRVVDDDTGEPLAHAIVRLHHDGHGERDDVVGTGLSDPDGEFTFRGLVAGNYTVVANESPGGRHGASRRPGIEVVAGRATERVELRARPAAGASALVTTATGAPVQGATVLCTDPDGRPLGGLGLTATDSAGVAWFGGMADGPARVVARAPGMAPAVSDVQQLSAAQATRFTVVLTDGAPTTLRLIDAAGQPALGGRVTARCGDGPWLPAALLLRSAGADGTLDLGELGPGRWRLRVVHPARGEDLLLERTIRGTAPVTVVVEPGGR